MRVALFIPCFIDQIYPGVAEATVSVLQAAGIEELVYPRRQVCCGQPAFNSGYWRQARSVAGRWLEAFHRVGPDAIVAPSGSCAAMVRRHFYDLWPADSGGISAERRGLAERLSPITYELCEFLVEVRRWTGPDVECRMSVALHCGCHQSRILGSASAVHALLRKVRGLTLLEPVHADLCCGFGGTFAVKFSAVSSALAARKAGALAATGADAVTGADMSCLMQIVGWMRHHGLVMPAWHVAEILAGRVAVEED